MRHRAMLVQSENAGASLRQDYPYLQMRRNFVAAKLISPPRSMISESSARAFFEIWWELLAVSVALALTMRATE